MDRIDIPTPFPGAPVYYVERTGSTMDEARRLAAEGVPHGTVIAAGYQEKGRGRLPGRPWESRPGDSLLFTLILRAAEVPFPRQLLPLLAGLGLCMSLERSFGLRLRVKWPNDLLADGAKLAGILCEQKGRHLFAGIGLNCNQQDFPPPLDRKAVSLHRLLGGTFSPLEILPLVLPGLRESFDLGGAPGAPWQVLLSRRLHLSGETVQVLLGDPDRRELLSGIVVGIGLDGSLQILPPGAAEPVPVYSGEILLGTSAGS